MSEKYSPDFVVRKQAFTIHSPLSPEQFAHNLQSHKQSYRLSRLQWFVTDSRRVDPATIAFQVQYKNRYGTLARAAGTFTRQDTDAIVEGMIRPNYRMMIVPLVLSFIFAVGVVFAIQRELPEFILPLIFVLIGIPVWRIVNIYTAQKTVFRVVYLASNPELAAMNSKTSKQVTRT